MKLSLSLIGLFATIARGQVPTSRRACTLQDEGAIARCADPLYEIGAFQDDGPIQGFTWEFFSERGKHYFEQLCKAYFRFDLCVEPFKEFCFDQEPIKGRYQTATEILQLMCRDGYKDVTESFNCLVNALSRSEMIQCQRDMVSQAKIIADRNTNYNQDEHVCRVLQDYLRCVHYPIRYECGTRAWSVVQQVVARPTSIMMPQCPLISSAPLQSSKLPGRVIFFIAIFCVFVMRFGWL